MAEMFSEVNRNKWNSFFLISIFIVIITFIGLGLGNFWGNIYAGAILAAIFAFF